MAVNPWFVDSLQTFWQLKCPECTFDSKEEDTFKYHAVTKHPMSLVLFGKEFNYPVENPIIDLIKTEISQEKCFDKSFNSVNDNYEQELEVDDNEIENIEITDDHEFENSSETLASNLHQEFVIKEEYLEFYEDLENKNIHDTNISVKRQLKRKCNKERYQEEEKTTSHEEGENTFLKIKKSRKSEQSNQNCELQEPNHYFNEISPPEKLNELSNNYFPQSFGHFLLRSFPTSLLLSARNGS